mgnify:CR=1 FL=1
MKSKQFKLLNSKCGNNRVFFSQWRKLLIHFVLPLTVVVCTVYGLFLHTLMRDQSNLLRVNSSKTSFTINQLFEEIYSKYQLLLMEEETFDFLSIPENALLNPLYLNTTQSVARSLKQLCRTDSFIEAVYLYGINHGYVLTNNGGSFVSMFFDPAPYNYFDETDSSFFVLPAYRAAPSYPVCLSVGYTINDYVNPAGLLVFKVNTAKINNLIASDLGSYLDSMYIIGRNGEILFSSNNDSSLCVTSDHMLWKAFANAGLGNLNIVQNRGKLFASQTLSNGLTLVFCANSAYYTQRTQLIQAAVILCLIITFALSLSMSAKITTMYHRSIRNVVSALSLDNDIHSFEDVEQVVQRIMDIISKNEQFEENLGKNVQQLKQTQSLALQYQFDPHFLFNALNSINFLVAEQSGINNDASKAILLLSSLMRTSMNTGDYILTLREELNYERKYIEMQQILNENAFQLIMDIDNDTLNCKVIKLMLQPIIENAFIHGAKMLLPEQQTAHNIYLSISSHIVNGCLQIIVKNNGSGLDREKLEDLRHSLEHSDILQDKHIGLNNVHQRIKLLFGAEYGCSLDADDNSFSVMLSLPASQ